MVMRFAAARSKAARLVLAAAMLGGCLGSPAALAQFPGNEWRREDGRRAASEYVVRPGDTLASIARAAGVPLGVILALNPRVHPQDLRVGDRILVPAEARGPARGSIEIRPGGGPLDTEVTIVGRGFRPNAPVRLLAGRGPYELRTLERLRADREGRVRARRRSSVRSS